MRTSAVSCGCVRLSAQENLWRHFFFHEMFYCYHWSWPFQTTMELPARSQLACSPACHPAWLPHCLSAASILTASMEIATSNDFELFFSPLGEGGCSRLPHRGPIFLYAAPVGRRNTFLQFDPNQFLERNKDCSRSLAWLTRSICYPRRSHSVGPQSLDSGLRPIGATQKPKPQSQDRWPGGHCLVA